MKAAVIHDYGLAFDTIKYEEVETPVPQEGELLVKVFANAINHCDTDLRKGLFGVTSKMPHVMGVDAVGEVVQIGSGVKNFKIGDRVAPHFMLTCGTCRDCIDGKENLCENADVLGVTVWGGYAEYLTCGHNHVVRIPDGLDWHNAVAGQIPFATAWEALVEVGKLKAGENVLITAAGGGVGSAGVQIAKLCGARVIAAAGDDGKLDRVKEFGADETINYEKEDLEERSRVLTGGRGVDICLEMIGGNILVQSINALSVGGRIASIGAHAGEQVKLDFVEFFRKHITLYGCGRSTKAQVEKVLDLIATEKLQPIIHQTFGLDDAASAHKLMESRNFFGRMILTR